MNRKVAVILVCLTAAGWLLSSRIVHDGIGEPDPPPRFAMNYRLSFPFARLKIDPVEMTFERRGDDLTVFVRCLEPVWAKPRQVRIGEFEAIGQGGGNSKGVIDCPGRRVPHANSGGNSFSDIKAGEPVWVGLDVEQPGGAHTRVMRGYVVQADGSLKAVPESAATPAWWAP